MFELLTVDYQASNAGELFAHSLHHTGFAVIKNHPVAASLVDEVYGQWQQFFQSPTKYDYQHSNDNQGYFPFKSENAKYTAVKDLKEFYHFFPWGRLPQGMGDCTMALYQQMNQLAAQLLDWLQVNSSEQVRQGFSMPLSQMIQNSNRTLIRILNYPPLSVDEDPASVRAAAHEDIGLLTLLPAATAKGLQVKDTQGTWHEVPCDYGTIVVNAGDTLTAITQGHYPATTHRVVNPEGPLALKPRLSMPLFLHPRDEVLLPDGRQAVDYLMQRLQEIGLA